MAAERNAGFSSAFLNSESFFVASVYVMHLSKSPVASASLQRRTRDAENLVSPYVQEIVSVMVYEIESVCLGAGLFQGLIVIPVTLWKVVAGRRYSG